MKKDYILPAIALATVFTLSSLPERHPLGHNHPAGAPPTAEEKAEAEQIEQSMKTMGCETSSDQSVCDKLRHRAAELVHRPYGGTAG
jgi:hypothetical protein